MTFHIQQLDGATAWELTFPDHFAMLSPVDQETMHRTMLNSSRVYLGCDDAEIFCVWGLIPPTLLSDSAYLWLYTSPALKAHIFTFIRHSQRVTEDMLREYPIIVGHGHADDPRSLRWLRWCGAEFGRPAGRYIPFEIRADQWHKQSA